MISSKRYVRDTFGVAWPLVKGCKWAAFWGLVPFVVLYCISQLLLNHSHHLPKAEHVHFLFVYGLVWPYVQILFTAPVLGGWYMMGIKRLAGMPIAKNEAYRYLNYALTLIVIAAISYFLSHIINYIATFFLRLHDPHVFSILTLVGIIYSIVMSFLLWLSMIIAIDLKKPFWHAMLLSIRIITRHFWPGLRLFICEGFVMGIGFLLLGIGLFWAIPWCFIATAKFYSDIQADLLELTNT